MSLRTPFILIALVAFGAAARADETDPLNRVELGFEGALLTQGQSNWSGIDGELSRKLGAGDHLTLSFGFENRFGESAGVGTATWQHDYSDYAYEVFSLTGSTDGLFMPSFGASTEFLHKIGGDHDWVVGLGGGGDGSRTGNQDAFGVIEAIRYLPKGWVIEGGSRVNLGLPGSVVAPRGFAALSWLPAVDTQYVFKVDAGDEAYQLVGSNNIQTRFFSVEASLEAIVPIGGGRQIHARVEQYHNDFYDRTLGYLGISQAF